MNNDQEHDRMVSGLPTEVLNAAAADLDRRRAHNPRDPQQHWIMGRLAAIVRELCRRNSDLSLITL